MFGLYLKMLQKENLNAKVSQIVHDVCCPSLAFKHDLTLFTIRAIIDICQ